MLARVAAVLVAAAIMVSAPGIAQARFSGTATSSLTAATTTLTAPAGAVVQASCKTGRALSISVTNHGTTPRATSYELTILDPSGTVVPTAGWTYAKQPAAKGTWTYQIRGLFTAAPGNIWTSLPYEGTVTC
ncbi:MAG: hypothetical protein WBX27_16175 [Specibacter sp.]